MKTGQRSQRRKRNFRFPTAKRAEEPSGVNYEKFSDSQSHLTLEINSYLTNHNFICRMESPLKDSTTPGGSSKEKSTIVLYNASGHTVLGSPNICNKEVSERLETPSKLKFKQKYYFGTINVNSLIRLGKQKEL